MAAKLAATEDTLSVISGQSGCCSAISAVAEGKLLGCYNSPYNFACNVLICCRIVLYNNMAHYDKTYHSQTMKNSAILVSTQAEFYSERNRPKAEPKLAPRPSYAFKNVHG